jgi:hypothetical protein
MNSHLSPEQMSKWVIGEHTTEEESHVRACGRCRQELAVVQNVLSQFRSSLVQWANHEQTDRVPDPGIIFDAVRRRRLRRLAWLPAAAAIILVTIFPVYKNRVHERPAEVVQSSPLDAELLERVNEHLSHAVPVSLQPLVEVSKGEQ